MSYIKVETSQAVADLENGLKTFFPGISHKIISRCINKTLGIANTQVNRSVMSKYNLKLRDLNNPKVKKIDKSTTVTLTGDIKADVSPLSLSKFNPSWIRNNNQRFGSNADFLIKSAVGKSEKVARGDVGVTVEIIKGHKEVLKSAFMVFRYGADTGASGLVFARGIYGNNGFRWGVYQRLPITKLNSKSIYYTIFNNEVERAIYNKIINYYPKELERLYNLSFNTHGTINIDSK